MDYVRKSGIKPGNYGFPDRRGRAAMESERVQKACGRNARSGTSASVFRIGLRGTRVN